MNKALIYRPGNRTSIFGAFAIAIGIHLSALAYGARHHEPSPTVAPDEGPPLEFELLPDDEPVPPPPEMILTEPPPPATVPDFVEDSTPPRPRTLEHRTAGPTRPPTGPAGSSFVRGNPRASAINAPRPEYPYEARRQHLVGSGVAAVTVDPASGQVVGAEMEKSIGAPLLDQSALSAFRRWKFKPGTPRVIRIPVTFDLRGAEY
jgi:protein TonB